MPSTFTSNLRLELQADGENDDAWGDKANGVFELIEDTLSENVSIVTTGGTTTLTTNNGAEDQARKLMLDVSGTLTGDAEIRLPTSDKGFYFFRNQTSGNHKVETGISGGTLLTILQGTTATIYCDGTNVSMIGPDSAGGTTGDIKYNISATANSGWVPLLGETLGSQASSADHAHNENEALFLRLWNSHADAQAAVVGGRGASAAADWAANKRITLPDAGGRVLAGKEASESRISTAVSGFSGATVGASGGGQLQTLTVGQLPSHNHPGSSTGDAGNHNHTGSTSTAGAHTHTHTTKQQNSPVGGPDAGDGTRWRGDASTTTGSAGDHSHTVTIESAGAHSHSVTIGSQGSGEGHPNVQPTLIQAVFIKK